MTDFSKICLILGDLYSNYKEQKEFKDFIEYNDIGLPLAYLVGEGLADVQDDGARYITETWTLFLASIELEDTGFDNLEDVFESANGGM